jgi:hypothetical protein
MSVRFVTSRVDCGLKAVVERGVYGSCTRDLSR